MDTGWTFYTPYSSIYSNTHVVLTVVGVFITGFSSILTGLNFIVTIHKMRAPGMTWFRLPLFIWAHYATSIIFILGTPVIAITLVLVALERIFHLGIFDPALGGDPVLFQHLFLVLLASRGLYHGSAGHGCRERAHRLFFAQTDLRLQRRGLRQPRHRGDRLLGLGPSHVCLRTVGLCGHDFFIVKFLVAIPSAIKVFNWTATLYKGSVSYDAPMLYALGFIGLFTIGGLTGLFLATLGIDVHVHDTYFVIAHFHYIMVGGSVMGYLGGIHFWWPKMTGRRYPEGWARLAALIIFIGFNLTFFPQFVLGYIGMPRRYHVYPPEFQVLNVMSTAGASILAVGYLLPLTYLIWSLRYGAVAGRNPWGARGLEWQTPSPPPTENFERTPIVTDGAYAYERILKRFTHWEAGPCLR